MLGISQGPVQSNWKSNHNMRQIAAILPCLQSEIHLLVHFCLKTKDRHSTTPLITRFSIVTLISFPKLKMVLKGRRFKITMIQENHGTCRVTNNTYHEMLYTMVSSLVSPLKVPRTLL
jgi:hypothetical protein